LHEIRIALELEELFFTNIFVAHLYPPEI